MNGAAAARHARRRAAAVLALALAGVATLSACAKKGPPSGGPPDLDPPRIVTAEPESGAAGVPRDARITLEFSEGMEPKSTGDAIALAPRVEIRQRRWRGRAVTLVLAESLRADVTYTLLVGGGARDRHGNPLAGSGAVVFSTSPTFPPGVLEGEIEPRGFTGPGTYLWVYEGDRAPDSTARDYDAVGLADDQNRFRIPGLAAPGTYRVWAFADLNRNRSFEPLIDVLAPSDTTITLTAGSPTLTGLRFTIVNPRAPGRVRGTVLDSLADSVGVLRILATSQDDSTRRLLFEAETDGTYRFEIAAGAWILRAFRDLDRNRSWQRDEEPASAAQPVRVEPAGELTDVRLVLERPGAEGNASSP
jgi:hypothetical protein